MLKSEITVKYIESKVLQGKDRVGKRGDRRVTRRDVGKCRNQKYQ